jgi:hypothetical protein
MTEEDVELVFREQVARTGGAQGVSQGLFSREKLAGESGLSLKKLADSLKGEFAIESIVLSVELHADTGTAIKLLVSAGGSAGCVITLKPRKVTASQSSEG